MDDVDAVSLRKCLIAMRERFQRSEPGEIEVAEKAGRVAQIRFNQRDLNHCRIRAKIFANRPPPDTPADHDDSRSDLASCHPRDERCEASRSGEAAEFASRPAFHGRLVSIRSVERYCAL